MKKLIHLFIGIALLLVSCQENKELVMDVSPIDTSQECAYLISEEEAIENLYGYLNEAESRSSQKAISNIAAVYSNTAISRSAHSNNENPLIYIANFEDNQGYAILAADNRVPEPVIAVVESGNINVGGLVPGDTIGTIVDRPRLLGYPLSGPGFYTTDQTGDQLLINPNTVDLYDEDKDDYLIGNFFRDNSEAVDSNGNQIGTNETVNDSLQQYTINLCIAYAKDNLDKGQYKNITWYDENARLEFENALIGGGSGTSENGEKFQTSYSTWEIQKRVSPMISRYARWHQGTPFNTYFPNRLNWKLNKRRAPAGCFPLATAKIMTYFNFPSYYPKDKDYVVDWNSLQNFYYDNITKKYTFGAIGDESAGRLLRCISSGCDAWYFYEGTFCFPKDVAEFFKSLGFSNVGRYNYTFERVKMMIDGGKPFITYATHSSNIFKGHAWIIDGYSVKVRTVTITKYIGNTAVDSTEALETCYMVHCDFGWGGKCNGDYVSGVFKTDVENYNTHIRMIMYDL